MSNNFELGLPAIDEQHQTLFASLDRLLLCLGTANSDATAASELQTLRQYAQTHFEFEESLMTSFGYPQQLDHAAQHAEFIARIDELHALPAQRRLQQTVGFLMKWLREHIHQADRDYVRFVLEQG